MNAAGIGEPGLFLDRQRIEFGAQHDGGTGAVLQNRDDTGATDVFGDIITERAQACGKHARGPCFLR